MPGTPVDDIRSFEDFYEAKIASLVNDYIKKSRSSNKTGLLAFLLLFAAIAVFVAYCYFDGFEAGIIIAIALFISFVVSVRSYIQSEQAFTDNFKMEVVKEIAEYLIPGIQYEPMRYLNSKLYKASSLYRRRVSHTNGNDLMEGTYKNVPFQVSELTTKFENGEDVGVVIFKGIFFVAETGRIQGGTYIWPRNDVQLPVSIAEEHYRMYPMPPVYKVHTEDPVFNKYFSVYSSYPAEAQLILSGDMTQRIVALKKQLKKSIRFSFVAGRFYAAVENDEDMMEPISDLRDKEAIKEIFFTILLYPALINQLKLYEYI